MVLLRGVGLIKPKKGNTNDWIYIKSKFCDNWITLFNVIKNKLINSIVNSRNEADQIKKILLQINI